MVAAKAYISASLARPGVKKFLIVSYLASRRNYPPWWTDEDKKSADDLNKSLADYYKAKLAADEHLEALTYKRVSGGDTAFQGINLRPGILDDNPPRGKVQIGKTPARGSVSRADVAAVADALLARDDTRGWFDLLQGDDDIDQAIDKVVKSGHNGLEGEDIERIHALAS